MTLSRSLALLAAFLCAAAAQAPCPCPPPPEPPPPLWFGTAQHNVPVPGFFKRDTITSVALVAKF